MVMTSVEAVLLAIRAGIKLGSVLKKGYIAKTRQGELVLPLPDTFFAPDLSSAGVYFADGNPGARYRVEDSRLNTLHKKLINTPPLSEAETEELLCIYREYKALEAISEKPGDYPIRSEAVAVDPKAWMALLTVRQYERGEVRRQDRKLLHMLAGSIVEVGIDYFATVPAALSDKSRYGKIIRAFVTALDEIPLADLDYERDWLNDLGQRLLFSTLETFSNHPELATSDPNIERLVKITTSSLTKDVQKRLDLIRNDNVEKGNLKDWAELIFASVLSNAGREVVSNPARYLGLAGDERNIYDSSEGQKYAVLIETVGKTFMDLAVDEGGLTLARIIGREGIDSMVRASLAAIARHPALLGVGASNPMSALVTDLAGSLSQNKDRFTIELLPEVFRLILIKSGGHFDLFWQEYLSDPQNPRNHLALTAAKKTIQILTSTRDGKWTLRFSREDVLTVIDTVLEELAVNPNWLLKRANEIDEILESILGTTLDVIRKRGSRGLSTEAAATMLKSALLAAAMRVEFVSKTGGSGEPLVAAAADSILAILFPTSPYNEETSWQLLRTEAIVTVFRSVLFTLAKKTPLDDTAQKRICAALADKITRIVEVKEALDLEALAKELESKLLF